MKFDIKLKVGTLVAISGKDYIVDSVQLNRRVRRRFTSETTTISLFPVGVDTPLDDDLREIVFFTDEHEPPPAT